MPDLPDTCGLRQTSSGQILERMADGDQAPPTLKRLRAAEERARRAERRVALTRHELERLSALDRTALLHELAVHERAAATHRRAVEFQREHLAHQARAAR
jgi:hypothetical protein